MATPTETGGQPASSSSSKHAVPATAILVTDRIYLRPYEEADAEVMAEQCNEPEIAKNMRSRFPSPYTLADAHAWIEYCHSLPVPTLSFGVFTLSGELAGSIGLEAPKGDRIYAGTRELGYFGSRKFWGRGVMSEAVREFTRWAFASLPDLLRIEAVTFEHNEASKRILSKAGFVKEGSRRLAVVKNGKLMAEDIFGLIRTDLEA